MTSQAIAMNDRPVVALREPVTAIPSKPACGAKVDWVAEIEPLYDEAVGEDYLMYLQLRATPQSINKCLTHLERHLQAHPEADAEIVGIGTDQHTIRVIIAVNLGDSFKIKARSKTVMAAYTFVRSLSANLANFWPQYLTGTPTDEERDLLASVVAAGAITKATQVVARPSAALDADVHVLPFDAEQEFVLAGDRASWPVETAVA